MKPLAAMCFAALVLALASAARAQECGDCHDQKAHGRSLVCESCHGPGQAHIESGGEKEKIAKPAARDCLQCHDRVSHRTSVHSNCLSCHAIHTTVREPHLLKKPQLALCSTCHSPQAASFRNKPFAHRIGRGGMNCASCHEPHGRPARQNSCLACHADKRGPFVFQHASSALGDCTTCHEQHGSSNPKRLKRATVWQLCIECHSPIESASLGSQPPSFHNLSDPRYRDCTTCHVAIHGSNRSPQLFK